MGRADDHILSLTNQLTQASGAAAVAKTALAAAELRATAADAALGAERLAAATSAEQADSVWEAKAAGLAGQLAVASTALASAAQASSAREAAAVLAQSASEAVTLALRAELAVATRGRKRTGTPRVPMKRSGSGDADAVSEVGSSFSAGPSASQVGSALTVGAPVTAARAAYSPGGRVPVARPATPLRYPGELLQSSPTKKRRQEAAEGARGCVVAPPQHSPTRRSAVVGKAIGAARPPRRGVSLAQYLKGDLLTKAAATLSPLVAAGLAGPPPPAILNL